VAEDFGSEGAKFKNKIEHKLIKKCDYKKNKLIIV
jgi:hypothetical protein